MTQAPSSNVSLANLTRYYTDIRNLYYDRYGKWICELDLNDLLNLQLQPNVAVVDLDPKTKDLPYAHFDAETFTQSNQRVIDFINQINGNLTAQNYKTARKLSGQIMHTIQDFYSHSNWIEMGMTLMNTAIGTASFNNQPVATLADNVTCVSNCTLIQSQCSSILEGLSAFLEAIGFKYFSLKCPLPYYRCSGNLVQLNKLVSGYYTGQALTNGQPYNKPNNTLKCSHGGILDKDSTTVPAIGGINKDSGKIIWSI
jgi:hypothetical protein